MAFPDRLAIASRNAHKLRELGRICADWPVEWVTVENHDPTAFPDVEETGQTYPENAILKATQVAAALGVPAIADDSGIEVDALGGGPGHRSARYAGEQATDEQNLDALLRAVRGCPPAAAPPGTDASRRSRGPTGVPFHAEGVCEGALVSKRRGCAGSATTRSSCRPAGTRRWPS